MMNEILELLILPLLFGLFFMILAFIIMLVRIYIIKDMTWKDYIIDKVK